MIAWLWVVAGVAVEIVAVTLLAAPPRRHRRLAQTLAFVGVTGSVLFLIRALRDLPLDAVYGVWSAGGAAGIAVSAMVVLRRRPDIGTVVGIALTVVGTGLVLGSRVSAP